MRRLLLLLLALALLAPAPAAAHRPDSFDAHEHAFERACYWATHHVGTDGAVLGVQRNGGILAFTQHGYRWRFWVIMQRARYDVDVWAGHGADGHWRTNIDRIAAW